MRLPIIFSAALLFAVCAFPVSAQVETTDADDNAFSVQTSRNDDDLRGSVRFSINGGYSYRLGKAPESGIENFRSGFVVGGNLHGIFKRAHTALGIAFDYRRHSYDMWGLGDTKVKVNTVFLGPSWLQVIGGGNMYGRHGFTELALGYTSYGEKYGDLSVSYNTFGMKLAIGYVFTPIKTGGAYVKATLLAATIPNDTDYDTSDKRLTVASANITFGIAFGGR